jgi:hypothetical protein
MTDRGLAAGERAGTVMRGTAVVHALPAAVFSLSHLLSLALSEGAVKLRFCGPHQVIHTFKYLDN